MQFDRICAVALQDTLGPSGSLLGTFSKDYSALGVARAGFEHSTHGFVSKRRTP